MSLYWVAKTDTAGGLTYFIQEANTPLYASIRSAIAGHDGNFVEALELDNRTARKVPKDMRGRVLKHREAAQLIKKIGR